jgi:hypothetical protein
MEDLKSAITKYIKINKNLNDVNKEASELRDERRTVELDLAALYANNDNAMPEKIELKESQMMFTVKKPGQWKKGWSLSKKDLEAYLIEILPEHGDDVMAEIIRKHEPTLIADDFGFNLSAIIKK